MVDFQYVEEPKPKPTPKAKPKRKYTDWKGKYQSLKGDMEALKDKLTLKNTELREVKGMLMRYHEPLRRADLLFAIDTWIRAYSSAVEKYPKGETARRMVRMKEYREEFK